MKKVCIVIANCCSFVSPGSPKREYTATNVSQRHARCPDLSILNSRNPRGLGITILREEKKNGVYRSTRTT